MNLTRHSSDWASTRRRAGELAQTVISSLPRVEESRPLVEARQRLAEIETRLADIDLRATEAQHRRGGLVEQLAEAAADGAERDTKAIRIELRRQHDILDEAEAAKPVLLERIEDARQVFAAAWTEQHNKALPAYIEATEKANAERLEAEAALQSATDVFNRLRGAVSTLRHRANNPPRPSNNHQGVAP